MDAITIDLVDQERKLFDAMDGHLGCVCRLRQRIECLGYRPDDPLMYLVERTYDSAYDLYIEFSEYCASGVGATSKDVKPARRQPV